MDDYFKKCEGKGSFDSLFCCLGSQIKHGTDTFIKVDKTYPLMAADMAFQLSTCSYTQKFLTIYLYLPKEVILRAGFYTQERKVKWS